MKRLIFSLLAVIFSLVAESQSVMTYYQCSDKYIELRNIMETHDGNIIMNCPIFEDDNGMHVDLGTCLYKVSLQGELLDSLFIEDNDMLRFLLATNPIDKSSNVLVKTFRDFDNASSSLKISFFTDSPLEILNEVFVPLQDTIVEKDSYYLDPDNDIIVTYSARQRLYVARVGLDETLKDNVMLPESDVNYFQYRHVGLYNRFPREYCLWGVTSNDHAIKNVVVDSTLNFVSETKFGSCYDGESNEQIMYFNDSTYILSSFYGNTHYPYESGIHLSKFNKDNECIDMAIFIEGNFFMPFPIWAEKGADGGIYYSYVTDALGKQVAVVKMDDDFNICWKRYCLKEGPFHWGRYMIALNNGGVAVGGFDSASGPEYFRAFLLVLNDDGTSTPEMEDIVKPYIAYPNPAANSLHLDISPDTEDQVSSVSLYDISGRLVKTQSVGFETIDISGFAPGVYLMKVALENGKVFEEKIVKE